MPINPFSVGRKNAIIHFPGISEATNALATLHNFEIDGVQVRLCPCCAPAPRAPPTAVEALVRNVTSVLCASRFASIFHPVRRKKAHRAPQRPQTSRLMYVFFVTKFLFCTQPSATESSETCLMMMMMTMMMIFGHIPCMFQIFSGG